MTEALIENGFAKVGDGTWLVGAAQPVAVLGNSVPFSLKGFLVPDRSRLHLMQVTGKAACADASRPFLTRIPCAAPLTVVSDKFLVAPQEARKGGSILRVVPFSFRNAICTTECVREWVVMATKSRVTSFALQENDLLAVRMEAAVAWTTKRPTGFCPRIKLTDILIPRRRDRNLLLHFYGPGVVWVEGANAS